jgi:predicted PurR-regulated permease PerM
VVGFFDLIPLVGATIGAIVVALATLTVDFPTATIVWLAFAIVYQRFENYLVQPPVYGRAGAVLAIRIAAAVQVVLRDWWANRGEPPTPS